jgi:molybdate transport system regulatory protein
MPRHQKQKQRRPLPEEGYALAGRSWVDGPEGTFFGYGRAMLMERIAEHGSITKAAKSMDMSYRNAWRLIDSMNRQAPEPFVETLIGGPGGGGARLTEAGARALEWYWEYQKRMRTFLEAEAGRMPFRNQTKGESST